MRRFGRRKRAGAAADGRAAPIDAERWLGRIKEEGIVELEGLEVMVDSGVPAHVAAIGRGARKEGGEVLVAFAPRHAGDALLGALAAGTRAAEAGGFSGEAVALAPQWSGAARRRLALVRAELPFTLTAVAASNLEDASRQVQPEVVEEQGVTTPGRVASHLAEPGLRALFHRAAAALEGLASKHGGAIRAHGTGIELVILARRVAQLRIDEDGRLSLVTLVPSRTSAGLDAAGLAAAFDALEGQLRKRLADRRVRDGEEGIRTRLLPVAASAVGLRGSVAFPVGGSDSEAIDQVGVDENGRPVVVAARLKIDLVDLGRIIDALQDLRPHLSTLLAEVPPPVRLEAPHLVLIAESFDPSVAAALAGLSLAHAVYTLDREGDLTLTPGASGEAGRPARAPARGRGRRRGREDQEGEPQRDRDGAAAPAEVGAHAPAAGDGETPDAKAGGDEGRDEASDGSGEGRNRRRRRRGGRNRGRDREDGPRDRDRDRDSNRSEADADASEAPARSARAQDGSGEAPSEDARAPQYESLSLLDLDDGDDGGDDSDGDGSRRRRGRGRRRGRRPNGGRGEGGERGQGEAEGDEAPRGDDGRPRGRSGRGDSADTDLSVDDDADDDAEDLDDDDTLADLPESLAGVGDPLQYAEEDDEEEEADESAEKSRRTREREERRRARKAQTAEVAEPPAQRRRAVVVANADRDSLLGAVLLARDIRLLEGIWVYPQSELMTFFRSVATGVKDGVPIYLVGFSPSPARDVIQAASLYADRITWFDHHDWPPEDLQMVRQSIHDESLHLTPGVGSSLPAVLETCTRRSRFSDKLVDLATGRFTQHDYERWGRLWWHRLGEIAEKGGEVRADIDALLSGRPSDLAKEALKIEAPPRPAEVEYVSSRDFRLVRFAGYAMVVVDVDADSECDPLLAARIARERYRANLSLAFKRGSELVLFGGEETGGRRTLDFGALGEHLADKFAWVEALPDTDHVARFRVRGLDQLPSRLDEVVGTIAMGRSILEG